MLSHHATNHVTYVWQYNSVMDKDVDKIIQVFGKLKLQMKEQQMEVIKQFCEGNDFLVSLPTGFEK